MLTIDELTNPAIEVTIHQSPLKPLRVYDCTTTSSTLVRRHVFPPCVMSTPYEIMNVNLNIPNEVKLHSHAQKFVGRMYIRPTNAANFLKAYPHAPANL
jgi:hypothetical protein